MPVIEGQKTGRIVVTSAIEPLMEVAADAAVMVDPEDTTSIRNAYQKIIADASLRELLIKKGLENSERFSVQNIANQYFELYKTLK